MTIPFSADPGGRSLPNPTLNLVISPFLPAIYMSPLICSESAETMRSCTVERFETEAIAVLTDPRAKLESCKKQ